MNAKIDNSGLLLIRNALRGGFITLFQDEHGIITFNIPASYAEYIEHLYSTGVYKYHDTTMVGCQISGMIFVTHNNTILDVIDVIVKKGKEDKLIPEDTYCSFIKGAYLYDH